MEQGDDIKNLIKDVRQTIEDLGLEEPYKSIAFKTLLERRLGRISIAETREVTAAMEGPPTSMSFASFIKNKKLQTHEKRALSIAYFLWKFENRNFTYNDIIQFRDKVAWSTYSNPKVLMNQLKSKGYVEPLTENSKGEMEYRIVQPGIEAIEKLDSKT